MTCDDARALVHPYADGELDLMRSLEVEEHVRGCAACARELAGIHALHKAIGESAIYHEMPERLESRVRAALNGPRAAHPERDLWLPRVGWILTGAAAAIALFVVIVKRMPLFGAPLANTTAREIVADHVRSLMANHLADVLSSNQHTVKPWFDGKIDFSPAVADLGAEGFILIGGRLDYLDNHPAAAVVYRRRQHIINLFVWPISGTANSEPAAETHQGYNIVHWTKDGMAYWAVSNLNLAELREFARDVRGERPAPAQG